MKRGYKISGWLIVALLLCTSAITTIDLATQVKGNLSVNNLNGGTGASSTTAWYGDGTWKTPTRYNVLVIACSDLTTAITTGTTKGYFDMPYGATITGVMASNLTAGTGGVVTIDINEAGTSILSTKLTIDASEANSTTAATPAVISDANWAQYARGTIDFDGVNTGAAGIIVYIYYTY